MKSEAMKTVLRAGLAAAVLALQPNSASALGAGCTLFKCCKSEIRFILNRGKVTFSHVCHGIKDCDNANQNNPPDLCDDWAEGLCQIDKCS